MPLVELIYMRRSSSNAQAGDLFTKAREAIGCVWKRRADHRAVEPARFSSFVRGRSCGARQCMNCSVTLIFTSATAPAVPYCGYARRSDACPEVGSSTSIFWVGSERWKRSCTRLSGGPHRAPGPRHGDRSGSTRPFLRFREGNYDILVGHAR